MEKLIGVDNFRYFLTDDNLSDDESINHKKITSKNNAHLIHKSASQIKYENLIQQALKNGWQLIGRYSSKQ